MGVGQINDLALQVSAEAIVLDEELKQLSEEVLQGLEKLGQREKKREQKAFLESRRLSSKGYSGDSH